MSDWSEQIKPIAKKFHMEQCKKYGSQYVGPLIEAMEIARRQAEIDQTIEAWGKRHNMRTNMLMAEAADLFKSLCYEFGPQRAVHVLTALEREHTRAQWGTDLKRWRGEMPVTEAALTLGLAVEDIQALENCTFSGGPEVMRLVRPALKRVRGELKQ